ncbi:MAG: ATP synthase Fo complex subunit b [Candidatus Westeberhardia cardiocondylae]|nr:ATP synthase Fo complex subunit b [Candidatus Westeberhardia cardiocondylae]
MSINSTIFGQIISFIIFVFLCMKYVWPPLISMIEDRKKKISDDLTSIKLAKMKLKISKEKIKKEIINAKLEAKLIIENASQYKLKLLNAAVFEAKIKKNRIIEEAYSKINLRKKYAEKELRKKIITLVMLASEKVIQCSMDTDKDNKIVNKIISTL